MALPDRAGMDAVAPEDAGEASAPMTVELLDTARPPCYSTLAGEEALPHAAFDSRLPYNPNKYEWAGILGVGGHLGHPTTGAGCAVQSGPNQHLVVSGPAQSGLGVSEERWLGNDSVCRRERSA